MPFTIFSRNRSSSRALLILGYSILFVGCFGLFSLACLYFGKSFIWSVDGLEQQYPFFLMQGNWIRELLNNIFIKHTFVVPMWSESIGYGADYVYSLGNTLGNPINWLSVFARPENAEYWLCATVFITLYLAGLCFMGYSFYKKFDSFSSICASMVYVFGGYSIIAFTQIFMVYPLVTAPLVLWGVDKIFDEESPSLFIFGTFLCFFCSVSLAYSTCISLFVYCLVRVLLIDKFNLKTFFLWFFKILGLICLSAAIAAVMFLPNAMALLGQGRLSLDRSSELLYSPTFYISLAEGFISYSGVGEDCLYGFPIIAFISVASLFIFKEPIESVRTNKILKILFIIFSIFICLPFIGRIYNGMAYANNRWVWSYCLLISVIVAYEIPRIRHLLLTKSQPLFICCAVYGFAIEILVLICGYPLAPKAALLLLVTILLLFVFASNKAVYNGLVVGSIAFCILLSSLNWGNNHASDQVDLGAAYDYEITDNPITLLNDVSDSDSQRYDTNGFHAWRNGNIAGGFLGANFYNSLYNGYIDSYHSSLGLATSSMNFSFNTLNSRTLMEALAGTKYFVVNDQDLNLLPSLFNDKVASGVVDGQNYGVYKASSVLPLAFCYPSWISSTDFEKMSLMQRQDTLSQAVVIENPGDKAPDNSSVSNINRRPTSYSTSLTSSLDLLPLDLADAVEGDSDDVEKKGQNVSIDGRKITVYQPNTTLYLNADIPIGEEAYFVCEGMDYAAFPEDEHPPITGVRSLIKAMNTSGIKDTKIFVSCDGETQEIWFMNNKHHLYGGKNDWAVNMGSSDAVRHCVSLTFSNPGTYTFDSFGLYATDVSQVARDIEDLCSRGASNISKITNGYTCSADISEGGSYLYFRVPYSSGWKATVDGKRVKPVCANLGFMALPLSEGHHDIELNYETPFLVLGAIISVIGFVVYCVLLLLRGTVFRLH